MNSIFPANSPLVASTAAPVHCVIETLEQRQLLSASLQVQNQDIIPGYERMIFNKIGVLDANVPNKVKDTGTLRLRNVGDTALKISSPSISGPFKVVGTLPTSIAAGAFADVKVQFTATAPPKFTYNQTAGFTRQYSAGTYLGTLKFNTNDPKNPTYSEALAGWYQSKSEDNQEPSLQTVLNLVMDYKTNIAPARTVTLTQGSTPKYYGEEVVSAYWQRVDPAKSISVRQIAAFHGQGNNVPVSWYPKSSKVSRHLFTHDGRWGQSFLPKLLNGTPAAGSFSTSEVFGFEIGTEYSDRTLNKQQEYGGGHHVRFYPARDHFGNALANTYFMVGDYSNIVGKNGPNYDFQDNVYVITNVKPAGSVTPPPTSPPVSPPPTSPPPPASGTSPRVSIGPISQSVLEGNSGTKAVTFTVSIDRNPASAVNFYYTTANGGAVGGSDFTAASGSLAFYNGGVSSKTITVYVRGDIAKEANEDFFVNLYGIRGGTLANVSAKATILNND